MVPVTPIGGNEVYYALWDSDSMHIRGYRELQGSGYQETMLATALNGAVHYVPEVAFVRPTLSAWLVQ